MPRIHRSLRRRADKIDVDRVANAAEDYIDAFKLYKSDLQSVKGLCTVLRLQAMVKKIDQYEKEVVKLENKIEALLERRALEAVRLDEELKYNLEMVEDYLGKERFKDFIG